MNDNNDELMNRLAKLDPVATDPAPVAGSPRFNASKEHAMSSPTPSTTTTPSTPTTPSAPTTTGAPPARPSPASSSSARARALRRLRPRLSAATTRFSRALKNGTRFTAWKTNPMLAPRNSVSLRASNAVMSVPPMMTLPLVGVSKPPATDNKVVFPDPEGPTIIRP